MHIVLPYAHAHAHNMHMDMHPRRAHLVQDLRGVQIKIPEREEPRLTQPRLLGVGDSNPRLLGVQINISRLLGVGDSNLLRAPASRGPLMGRQVGGEADRLVIKHADPRNESRRPIHRLLGNLPHRHRSCRCCLLLRRCALLPPQRRHRAPHQAHVLALRVRVRVRIRGRTIRVRARANLTGSPDRLRGSARGGRPRCAPRRPQRPAAQWAARAGRARLCPSRRRGPRRRRAPRPSTGW
eukprot:scaffold11459_cov64-Phaeocystis_antarctica.AAC.1